MSQGKPHFQGSGSRVQGPGPASSSRYRPREHCPDISVIVACYNAAETVTDTLASLRQQTHQNWEAVCVDDGSTDHTPRLLQEAAETDPRMRCTLAPHRGQPATKNHGISLARADRVMILDADDVARPDALATLLRVSKATGNRYIIAPAYELVDRRGRSLSLFHFPHAPGFSVDVLLRGNCLPSMSLVPRFMLGPQAFDESLPTCIDWSLWLRLAQAGAECVTLRRVLFDYRLHESSLSHNSDRMVASGRRLLERWAPHARDRHAVRDARHRLGCVYGAIALASGSRDALRRYLADLPPSDPAGDFHAFMADTIRSAFQFVHGASGKTWRDYADAWLADIEQWLADGPLAAHADEILARLKRARPEPVLDVGVVRDFLARRPEARRVLIYGLGRNGAILLEQLRSAARMDAIELCVADDHADALVFLAHGLSREDPRCWNTWPERTVAVVTPNDCRAMRDTLVRVGGREDTDFIAISQHSDSPTAQVRPEVIRS